MLYMRLRISLLLRFPNRVGRVAIDGMVDASVWSSKQTHYVQWNLNSPRILDTPPYQWFVNDWLSSTEGVYDKFFQDCSQVRHATYL